MHHDSETFTDPDYYKRADMTQHGMDATLYKISEAGVPQMVFQRTHAPLASTPPTASTACIAGMSSSPPSTASPLREKRSQAPAGSSARSRFVSKAGSSARHRIRQQGLDRAQTADS